MSPSDSIAWRIEADPVLRSTIVLVMRLASAPDHDVMRDKLERASISFPRMRQRVVTQPLDLSTPIWAYDPYFDLDFHFRTFSGAGDGSFRALLDIASTIGMQAFDWARPLWQATIVDGLEGDTSAFIMKIHHSLTDGIGGVLLMSQLFDFEQNPSRPSDAPPKAPAGETFTPTELLVDTANYEAGIRRGQLRSLATTMATVARNPLSSISTAKNDLESLAHILKPVKEPLSPVMRERSPRYHFEMFTVPLSDLKDVSHRVKGKLNDAFMAGVTGALRKYHDKFGEDQVTHLRVNMPISLRPPGDTSAGGNKWVPSRFTVPIKSTNIGEHMRELHNIVAHERGEPALNFTENIADLMNQLPTQVVTDAFGGMLKALDFVATNIPGVPIPVYAGGAEITAMIPFAPPAGASVNFALLSYQDDATIGINTDPAAVSDPELLLDCSKEAFAEVLAFGKD